MVEDGPINTIKGYSNTCLESLSNKVPGFGERLAALKISHNELKSSKDITALHAFMCE